MTIIIQRHNLFLSPLWEGKTIIGEQTCHWLILQCPTSVPVEGSVLLVEVWAGGRSVGQGCLWPVSSDKPSLTPSWLCHPRWHSLWVKSVDLHTLTGKFQSAAWVVSQGLTWPQTWGPRVTGRREREVLGVEWDWETIRHWCVFRCPSSAVQPSVTPDIIIHFKEDSETLQAEMSMSSQLLLCFYVDLQSWATDSGNNSFF